LTKSIPVVAPKAQKTSIRKPTAKTATGDSADPTVRKLAAPGKMKAQPKRTRISTVQPEERQHLIEVAAYYIAVAEEIHGTSPHDHWLEAEREIDAMIASGKFAG